MIVGPKLKLNSQYEPTPTSNGKLATFNFEFPPKVQVGGLWGSVSAGLRVAGSRLFQLQESTTQHQQA